MTTKFSTLFLVIVAALWGLTFPLIEASMKLQDPFLFVALRFSLAALPLLPYFFKHLTKELLIVGIVVGLLNCGAFLTQTIGLQTINASRAAFITGIYVLLIPFFSPLFKMGKPGRHEFLSAAICCIGIYVLTGCNMGKLSIGDMWIFACAFFTAISIIYIGRFSKNNLNPYMIAYSQIVMTAIFAWMFCPFFSDFHFAALKNPQFLSALTICSFFATILAIVLQSKYQKYVSLQKTALIFSLEPLFASCFDTLITGIAPKLYTIIGGVLILGSIIYLEVFKPKKSIVEPE
ncbi:MAG: DMT family transporter [Chlamydiota bacterium]